MPRTLTDRIASGELKLPDLDPRALLDSFGEGLVDPAHLAGAPQGTIPFGDQGLQDGWTKAPIGCLFDLLGLDRAQRKRLWAVVGKPGVPFHLTRKGEEWFRSFEEGERKFAHAGTGMTPAALFDHLCSEGALSPTLKDAVRLACAVARAFNVTYTSWVDGTMVCNSMYAYARASKGECQRCQEWRAELDSNDLVVLHLLEH